MAKLERSVVRIGGWARVPTGYSFNLDGTNIYMTLATLLSRRRSVSICRSAAADHLLWQLTSKGGCGAGFITLAATLSVVNPALYRVWRSYFRSTSS